jgi:hypothetical protein
MIDATCRAEDELMEHLEAGEEGVAVLGSPVGDKGQGPPAGEAG